jgi:transposase
MTLAASTITALYKGRWEIETFFRWIKQNLRIKSFIGTSENAAMTQVWVAMILYLLLSFIKYQTRFAASITELLRIIREVLLETTSLIEYLRINWTQLIEKRQKPVRLSFLYTILTGHY